MSLKKAVLFDRDGTLIIDKHYLNDPEGVEFLPGAFEALARLRDAGFLLIVVTNQSGIARGLVQTENLVRIHEKMQSELAKHGLEISRYYHSPHLPESDHPTRKPNPGMLLQAIQDFHLDREQTWMVGDKPSDIEAGRRAGVRSILLNPTVPSAPQSGGPWTVATLDDVASLVLSQSSHA